MLAIIALIMTTTGLVILGYRVVAIGAKKGFRAKCRALKACCLDWSLSLSLAFVGSITGGVTGGSAGLLAGPIISLIISKTFSRRNSHGYSENNKKDQYNFEGCEPFRFGSQHSRNDSFQHNEWGKSWNREWQRTRA